MWNSTVFPSDRRFQFLRDTLFVCTIERDVTKHGREKKVWANKTTTMSRLWNRASIIHAEGQPRWQIPPHKWGVGDCCGADSAGFLIKSKNINCTLRYQSGRCYQVSEWSGWRSIKRPGGHCWLSADQLKLRTTDGEQGVGCGVERGLGLNRL